MTDKAATEKPTPHLTRLAASLGHGIGDLGSGPRPPAPVERWNPPYCGAIDMRIAADGTWFYEGTPINRPALVDLFASILRKDGDQYVLVTPVERVGITVEDVPFVAVAFDAGPDTLRFITNLGDEVAAGAHHPLRFSVAPDGGIKPYVHVRGDLWARLTRGLAVELMDHATTIEQDGIATVGVRSDGVFFAIGPVEALA